MKNKRVVIVTTTTFRIYKLSKPTYSFCGGERESNPVIL
nr:MAG TPA: hypothetical protein [Caudoviricetes sp.]